MNKHALMLSRYFPPAFDVGGKRAYRFARYLQDEGWDATLVVGPPPGHGKVDETPLELPNNINVLRSIYPESVTTNRQRDSDGTVAKPVADGTEAKGLKRVSRALKTQFRLPVGDDVRFAPHVARVAAGVHKSRPVDVVWATSAPYAVLVYGAAVKLALGVPLILDLRDPWSPNFLARRRATWRQHAERAIEQGLFTYADHVILNCNAALEEYQRLYPALASKMSALTNAFDPAQRPKNAGKHKRNTRFQLVHFGNCYGPRSAVDVLKALRQVIDRRQLSPKDIEFVNLGRVAERDLNVVAELSLEPFFSFRPFVPYAEGMELLAAADLQVLLAYGSETLFLPAKLYDYMLSESALICVAERSELTDIVERCGLGPWAPPGDIDGIARGIEQGLDGQVQGRREEAELAAFSAPRTTQTLAEIFSRTC